MSTRISIAALAVVLVTRAGRSLGLDNLLLRRSGEPRTELGKELASGGLKSADRWSWAVGAVVFGAIWIVI